MILERILGDSEFVQGVISGLDDLVKTVYQRLRYKNFNIPKFSLNVSILTHHFFNFTNTG